MDYNKNCLFLIERKEKHLRVKNNRGNGQLESFEIFKTDAKKKSKCGSPISEENFFEENNEGIFAVRILYKEANQSKRINYYINVKDGKLILQRSKYPKDLSGSTKKFDDALFLRNKEKIKADKYFKILNFYIINNPSISNKKPITVKYYDIKKYWGGGLLEKGRESKTKINRFS